MPKRESRIICASLAGIFLVFLVFPLGFLFTNAFKSGSGIGLQAFAAVFTQRDFFTALGNSFLISAVCGVVTTLLAFIMAYTVNYTRLPAWLKSFIIVMTSVPMLVPTITYGFAIIYSFGKQGFLTHLFGRQLIPVYGFFGMLLGYVTYTLPIAFLLLHNTFKYIDKKYLTVSELMGDRPLKQFVTTTLRPMVATIGTAFIQSFFLCFTDYGIPAAIGGEFNVVANTLYNQMLGASPDFGKGSVVAIMMLVPSIVSISVQGYLDKKNFRYSKISVVELKKNRVRDIALGTATLVPLFMLLSIFIVVFMIPFLNQWPYDKTFSLGIFFKRLQDPAISATLKNSLLTASVTAFAGTVVAYGAGLVSERSNAPEKAKKAVNVLALITNTIPGMVLGVAYMMAFSGTPMQNTLAVIIISNIVHFFSTPYFMVKNALGKMNASWETTAQLMGDSWIKTVVRVILPNSVRTLAEVFSYYFINAMVTVSAVVFIAGARTMVLTTKIKELQHYGKFEEIFVLSLIIFTINLLMKVLVRILSKKGEKQK